MTTWPYGWTCLGTDEPHLMDPEHVAELRRFRDSITRCRACGQLYRYECFDVSDWSGDSDYSDTTYIWTAIESDEVAAIRQDPNYKPRSGRVHRYDTGWRSG